MNGEILNQLMLEKYGPNKFELGCQLVASFVGHGSTEKWTALRILQMSAGEERGKDYHSDDIERFKKLFGEKALDIFFKNRSPTNSKVKSENSKL